MRIRNLFSLVIPALICSTNAFAQKEDLSVMNYWKYYNEQPAALYQHLTQKAFSSLENRKQAIAALRTKEDWVKRQQLVRTKLQETVGAFPEKTPLNPVVSSKIEKDEVAVENLYFESLPNYYVTASFFKPATSTGKLPTIIFCSGHSANGYRSDTYQHIILNYVKKGFAVLAFDPIGQGERIQYFKTDGTNRFGPTHEHSYPGSQTFLAGTSPARYFIWDGIRSVDYLLTRPDVDGTRLGITGRSGGGTQAAYIAAFDERIVAAAPENYLTTFDKLLKSNGPQDAEQNFYHFIDKGLDLGDLVQVRAPKPLLMVTTTRDIFSIQGARDLFKESQNAYKAHGKVDNLSIVEDDAGHASTLKNREASYAFFQKHLQNPGTNKDEKTTIFTDKELYATPTGNVYNSIKGHNLFSVSKQYSEKVITKRKAVTTTALPQIIKNTTNFQSPKTPKESFIFSGRIHREQYAIEKYLVRSAGNYYIPVLWLKPLKSNGKQPVLYFDEAGKEKALAIGGTVDLLAQQGQEVVLADISGTGELAEGYMKGGDAKIDGTSLNLWYAGILTNQTLVGTRLQEIELVRRFAHQLAEKPTNNWQVIAKGAIAADALHDAVLHSNQVAHLVLVDPLISFQSITETENYQTRFMPSAVPGAIIHYDLPDLVNYLTKKTVTVVNPTDAAGQVVNQSNAQKHFSSSNHSLLNSEQKIVHRVTSFTSK